MPQASITVQDFTVGWICAVNTEYVVARKFLDLEYRDTIALSNSDENVYTYGRIGSHNVVICCLPKGQYGIGQAASVAKDMLRSFPSIRFGLLVGIGGGAPSDRNDIRLGDVVVSSPDRRSGGVIQYDFGKVTQNGAFEHKGSLDAPPKFLLSAVQNIQAQHEGEGHRIVESIERLLELNPKLKAKYRRPPQETDRLYKSHVVHQDPDQVCSVACGTHESQLIKREPRGGEGVDPAIHYGLIASADKVMRDANIRDTLAREEGVLCFEMEAAGLMQSFRCLVIRGICDYSDSHKNDIWQGYAAMAAAAYAKELVNEIPASAISNTTPMDPSMFMKDFCHRLDGYKIDFLENMNSLRENAGDQKTLLESTSSMVRDLGEDINALKKMSKECSTKLASLPEDDASFHVFSESLNKIESSQDLFVDCLLEITTYIKEQREHAPQDIAKDWKSLEQDIRQQERALKDATKTTTEAVKTFEKIVGSLGQIIGNQGMVKLTRQFGLAGDIANGLFDMSEVCRIFGSNAGESGWKWWPSPKNDPTVTSTRPDSSAAGSTASLDRMPTATTSQTRRGEDNRRNGLRDPRTTRRTSVDYPPNAKPTAHKPSSAKAPLDSSSLPGEHISLPLQTIPPMPRRQRPAPGPKPTSMTLKAPRMPPRPPQVSPRPPQMPPRPPGPQPTSMRLRPPQMPPRPPQMSPRPPQMPPRPPGPKPTSMRLRPPQMPPRPPGPNPTSMRLKAPPQPSTSISHTPPNKATPRKPPLASLPPTASRRAPSEPSSPNMEIQQRSMDELKSLFKSKTK